MPETLPLQQAHDLLLTFETQTNSLPDMQQTRAALKSVAAASDDQILGILAETFEAGVQALTSYATALGYTVKPNLEPVDGPVYIKFNPQTDLCYCESYSGDHRGVLVSCQSAVEGGLNQMYGHLPLDLWQ